MTDLHVTTSHVRELSARQGEAAAQITTAAASTDGVVQNVWMSHGVICAESNMAVSAAESARKAACSAMNSVSSDLEQKLTTAATHYDEIDRSQKAALEGQMHPK